MMAEKGSRSLSALPTLYRLRVGRNDLRRWREGYNGGVVRELVPQHHGQGLPRP